MLLTWSFNELFLNVGLPPAPNSTLRQVSQSFRHSRWQRRWWIIHQRLLIAGWAPPESHKVPVLNGREWAYWNLCGAWKQHSMSVKINFRRDFAVSRRPSALFGGRLRRQCVVNALSYFFLPFVFAKFLVLRKPYRKTDTSDTPKL